MKVPDAPVEEAEEVGEEVAADDQPQQPPEPTEHMRPRKVDYSRLRRGRHRATNEEGIGAELEAMRAESRGSPLFGREVKRAAEDAQRDVARKWHERRRREKSEGGGDGQ